MWISMDFCLELAWICSKNLSCTLASDTEEPRRGHSTSLLRQSNKPGRLAGRVNDREPRGTLGSASPGREGARVAAQATVFSFGARRHVGGKGDTVMAQGDNRTCES